MSVTSGDVFAQRPTEFQDPYFTTREAYDKSLESAIAARPRPRGVIPEGMHIDDIRNPEYIGFWELPPGTLGLPFSVGSTEVLQLQLIRANGLNSEMQIVYGHGKMASRKRTNIAIKTWGDWYVGLNQADVGSVKPLVSSDPWTAMTDGQTLIVYDPHTKSTTFPTNPLGNSWTVLAGNTISWLSEGPGLGCLRALNSNYGFAYWNDFNATTDCEILVKQRLSILSDNTWGGGIELRRAADANRSGLQVGYRIISGEPVFGIIERKEDASWSVLGSPIGGLYSKNDIVYTRIKAQGSNVYAKMWGVDSPEPDWLIKETTHIIRPGFVGFNANGTMTRLYYMEVKKQS